MDFQEFAAVWKAYAEQRDADFKDRWQRMRMLASITIQPHLAKRHRVTPEKLLPFPWDKPTRGNKPTISAEEQRERMRRLVEKLGDELV